MKLNLRSGAVVSFKPRPLITATYVLMGACMVALGVWQLQRADEKIELQQLADDALAAEPLTLERYLSAVSTDLPTRITFVGQPLWDRQMLWDNRVYNGNAGYEAIVPVRVSDVAPLVLVNRGWLPLGTDRSNLPDVRPGNGDTEKESTMLSVTGIVTRPSKGFASGEAISGSGWPRVLQYLDYPAIEVALGEPVVTGLVEPGAQVSRVAAHSGSTSDAGVGVASGEASIAQASLEKVPLAAGTAASVWFADNWQPVASGPERHYGYAFQWFAMFIALTVLYFSLNLRRLKDNSGL